MPLTLSADSCCFLGCGFWVQSDSLTPRDHCSWTFCPSGLGAPSCCIKSPSVSTLAACQQRSSWVAVLWKHCSHLSMQRKVCLSSVWSIQRYRSQACQVGLADRIVRVCDFQPRQAQFKASANPFSETPPCFHGVTSSTRWLIVVEPPVWVLIAAHASFTFSAALNAFGIATGT